jgi:hypothetical protein
VDGCVRLPTRIDAGRLAAELEQLPPDVWKHTDRDPVVQAWVESFFVIGYPRGAKPLPPDDRSELLQLPYLRQLLRTTFPASPTRAIVARLLPHGFIPVHTDTPRYFRSTVRLSLQVDADGIQRLYCGGLWYDMAPGEVWAINNLQPHAIHNTGTRPRLNVLADYAPSDELIRLLAGGDHGLGAADETGQQAIHTLSRTHYRKNRWLAARYELAKMLRRRAWWR